MAKPKIWECEIRTKKFICKTKTSDLYFWNKQTKKLKKLYGADAIYHDGDFIVAYYKKRIGLWKSKRLDGVKV